MILTEDIEEPLTPSHLIVGHRLRDASPPQCPEAEEVEVDSSIVSKRAQYLTSQFWQKWRKEYLVRL